MRTIAIHSSRGGTGKTVIATNLSGILASRGSNVALLDLDFRAPSLAIIFSKAIKSGVNCWLNDFLNGKADPKQIVVDLSDLYNFKGKLLVGLANPAISAIQSVMDKSQAWELSAVKKLFSLLSYLEKTLLVDYCILDTSPGVQYSSINALAASDLSIMVVNSDLVDLEVTKSILRDIADQFGKKTVIILNKSTPETRQNVANEDNLAKRIEAELNHPVINVIPCYCDVLQAERMALLVVERPNHQFIKHIDEVANKIEEYKQ